MQEALNSIGRWGTDWGVKISTTKTVATCFSVSNTPQKFKLHINGRELAEEQDPTYLGVNIDKRLT